MCICFFYLGIYRGYLNLTVDVETKTSCIGVTKALFRDILDENLIEK